jgi:hypothetical protein
MRTLLINREHRPRNAQLHYPFGAELWITVYPVWHDPLPFPTSQLKLEHPFELTPFKITKRLLARANYRVSHELLSISERDQAREIPFT